jgi:hypothetical protein
LADLKERARAVASLPDPEYAELVDQVRGFSLAQEQSLHHDALSPSLAASAMDRHPDLAAISRTSRHISSDDLDSGIFEKTTSASMDDYDPSETERVGVIDYFNPSSPVLSRHHVPLTAKANVTCYGSDSEDDSKLGGLIIKSSSRFDDVLCDNDPGTEMQTIKRYPPHHQSPHCTSEEEEHANNDYTNVLTRLTNNMKYDEAVSCDSDASETGALEKHLSSDDNLDDVNVHQRLYSGTDTVCIPMMDPASDDEEMQLFDPQRRAPPVSCTSAASHNYGTIEPVDAKVSFFSHQPSSSSRGTFTETSQRNKRPPFGDPPSEAHLNWSAEQLLASKTRDIDAPNMPHGAPIQRSLTGSLSDSESKKKKKKKKKPSKFSIPDCHLSIFISGGWIYHYGKDSKCF